MSQPIQLYNPTPLRVNRGPQTFEQVRQAVAEIGTYLGQLQADQQQYFGQIAGAFNNSGQGFGPNIASATTISPTSTIHVVTGTATIKTINIPPGFNGPLYLVSQNGFSTTTGGNIAQGVTVPSTALLVMVYVPQESLFYITDLSIPDNSVGTAQLMNGAVTTPKLAVGATYASGETVSNASTPIGTSDTSLCSVSVNINASSDLVLFWGPRADHCERLHGQRIDHAYWQALAGCRRRGHRDQHAASVHQLEQLADTFRQGRRGEHFL